MWKAAVILLTLHSWGINAGNIYRNEWPPYSSPQLPVLQQPTYYSEYGPVLTDLASIQQKLYQQGLAPSYIPEFPSYTPTAGHENPNSYHHNHKGCNHGKDSTTTTQSPPKHEGKDKDKFHNIVKVDGGKKKNESEHAKRPIVEIDIKWPNITDKTHAIVANLNGTVSKITGQVEEKVTAIKQFVDKTQDRIEEVYQNIGNESTKLIDKINQKLKALESQIEKLKFGQLKQLSDLDEDESAAQRLDTEARAEPNVVESEIGKKFRRLEFYDADAELRTDLKNSIQDAVKKAQERFNKLIDDQVAKINNKIADITNKIESTFEKFQEAVGKLTKPSKSSKPTAPPTLKPTTEKYTTIHWKPKATTAIPKIATSYTTPEYFKYTVPYGYYKQDISIDRLDENADALEGVDTVKSESGVVKKDETAYEEDSLKAEVTTDVVKADDASKSDEDNIKVDGATDDDLKKLDETIEEPSKLDETVDEALKSNLTPTEAPEIPETPEQPDSPKSLDDLQSQVLESVRDTLKSDDDLLAIENNQSEVLENPEDKLKSDTFESVVEQTLAEELRNDDNLPASEGEKSQIDSSGADAARTDDDEDDGDATIESDGIDESEISQDEDANDEDGEENSQLNANQAASLRFDELEVIQLIPVIIKELKAGHVSEGEQVVLEKVFGDLWQLIVGESKRDEGEEMSPMLRTILESEEVRLTKRDITKQIGNDIYKNSVRRVFRGDDDRVAKPYISLDDDRKLMSPAERLLNMVAAIVHKENMKAKSKAKLKRKMLRKKKTQKNPLGIVTVQKPRQRYTDRLLSINRMKRSLIKFGSDLAEMKRLVEQVNRADESDEEEQIEDVHAEEYETEEDANDDYVNDDYYYDDEYQMDDDDDFLGKYAPSQRNPRSNFIDYENGSVNEFIHLARERERRQNNFREDEDDEDDYE